MNSAYIGGGRNWRDLAPHYTRGNCVCVYAHACTGVVPLLNLPHPLTQELLPLAFFIPASKLSPSQLWPLSDKFVSFEKNNSADGKDEFLTEGTVIVFSCLSVH